MAYLGLSPEPSQTDQCLDYCEWQARSRTSLTMEYMERPPGCTCPGEIAQPTSINKMTPQEFERYVKSSQGYWLMVAAIAALLLMNR